MPAERYHPLSFWTKLLSHRVATKLAPVDGVKAGLGPTPWRGLHSLPIRHTHNHFTYEDLWHKLRTGYQLRHWLPHQQLCSIDLTHHTHEHALITCSNRAKVRQHLAPCMLPFKHNGTPVRMFHLILSRHLADSLSHIPGLIAWSAIMANWHTVYTVRKTRALDAWHAFLRNSHQIPSQWHSTATRLIPPRLVASLLFAISRAISGKTLQPPKLVKPELMHHTSLAEKKAKQRYIRKVDAKTAFMRTLQRSRDLKLIYVDGSSKWHAAQGYIGGFGVFVENELNLSLYNPPLLGQTIQVVELLAVQTTLTMFRHQNIAIIKDTDGVFRGATSRARKWRARGWVSSTGLVTYSQLWDSLLHSIGTHHGVLEWYHVLSHQHIPGNEKANDLAEAGRLQNPLTFEQPFPIPPTPDGVMDHKEDAQNWPDPASSLGFDSLSAFAHSCSPDIVSMSSSGDIAPGALPSTMGINAFRLDLLGLSKMQSPLIHSPMFRLDRDPEPDTALVTPPLSVLGLEAMTTPRCIDSPTSSVDSDVPCIDFLQTSSPRPAWSFSTDVRDRSRCLHGRVKRW